LYEVASFSDITDETTVPMSERLFVSMLDSPFDGTIYAEVSDTTFKKLDEKYTVHDKKL
jgi:hypothetical protein